MSSRVKAVPAPVKGWNVRDALADLDEEYASILDNWFPQQGRVDSRPGYTEYCSGLGGDVETLAEYISGSSRKFLGAANGNIWDISTSTPSSLGSGYTNNRWNWAMLDASMGLVNGVDAPLTYNGTTVSAMTVSGPTITSLIGIHTFQGRSYFWEDDSQSVWYSAVNTLGGVLTEFPLGRVGNFGGKLLAMGSWTHDGGAGPDDYAVFFLTSGDTIVYQGTDPGSWALVGRFKLAPLIAQRAIIEIGGDLIAVTKDGYISLMGAITQGRLTDRGIISDQINPAVTESIIKYGMNWGWEAFHYPVGNMLMFNIPRSTNGTYEQHVWNTNTGAPCRFTKIDARTWGTYDDEAYFGGNGSVFKFDDGREDNGSIIDMDALCAPTWLGSAAYQKHLVMLQPFMAANTTIPLSIAARPDFAVPDVSYNGNTYPLTGAAWNVATWDVSAWAGEGASTQNDWYPEGQLGYNFRTRVKVRGNNQLTKWFSINYMYMDGGLV